MVARPGNSSAMRQLSRPNSSLIAIMLMIATKAILNRVAGAKGGGSAPSATPTTGGPPPRRPRPQPHHLADALAAFAVRPIRADGGRHDDRERGADAQLHAHLFGHAEDAEHLVERRHDQGAAADAEQPGENAGHRAAEENRGGEPGKLPEGNVEEHVCSPRPQAAATV